MNIGKKINPRSVLLGFVVCRVLSGGIKFVADTAHCGNGFAGFTEFGAQAANVDVNGAHAAVIVIAPDAVEEV